MSSQGPQKPDEANAAGRLLSALSSSHNRHVLTYLSESPGEVASLEELADHVVDREGGGGPGRRERVAGRLHHATLPKLAAMGVVDYDPRTNTVRYRGHPVVAQYSALLAEVDEGASCRR